MENFEVDFFKLDNGECPVKEYLDGKAVITSKNATELNQVVVDLIEGVINEDEK